MRPGERTPAPAVESELGRLTLEESVGMSKGAIGLQHLRGEPLGTFMIPVVLDQRVKINEHRPRLKRRPIGTILSLQVLVFDTEYCP